MKTIIIASLSVSVTLLIAIIIFNALAGNTGKQPGKCPPKKKAHRMGRF